MDGPDDRPNFLHRSRSHLADYRQGIKELFASRSGSPGQPDILSALHPVEEETQPRYVAKHFYPARLGEVLNDRYKIVAKLGYGMTATVWLAKNLQIATQSTRKYVTIKINVNTLSEEFLKGRRKISQKLMTANPEHPGYHHIRFSWETFKVRSRQGEHVCIVYDVLREPIDVCMRKWPGRRFSPEKLQILLRSVLQGLDYMHSECRVVHTDLKPDNIMMGLGDPSILDHFVQSQMEHPQPRKMPDHYGRVIYKSCSEFGNGTDDEMIKSAKIIDIGLAEWGDQPNNKPIQSNAFTAPEVILAAGWSYPADIWNLGVMLWDIVESFGLFDYVNTTPGQYQSAEHLGAMISLMGHPPKELLERGSTSATYFDENGQFRKPEYITDLSFESSVPNLKGEVKEVFLDFAKKMICWLPEERWTAKQLLEHPFLTKEKFSKAETAAEAQQSVNLVDQYATTKPKSVAATPTQGITPPSRTPTVSPVPSLQGLNISGPSSTTRSSKCSTNTVSQDLIDQILGHRSRQ